MSQQTSLSMNKPVIPVWLILVSGAIIGHIGFGLRSSFGMYLGPMVAENGWQRADYALAMAVQNLLWGLAMPLAGWLADRFGAAKVIMVGAIVYALGIAGMVLSHSPFVLLLTGGIMVGIGIALSAFSLAIVAMIKVVGPQYRTLIMGLGTAAGSSGQVIFSPIAQLGISHVGWVSTLSMFAASALLMIPLCFLLQARDNQAATPIANGPLPTAQEEPSFHAMMAMARSHQGFIFLTIGFFVCGFQVAFIGVHLPVCLADQGFAASEGAYALSLIGLFNIVGSLGAGYIGTRFSMKYSLALIYLARSVVIALFIHQPITENSITLFAMVIGILWLSTVPLTNALIAKMFGLKWLATLYGIVFLSHQIGSFVGVWWGGYVYDHYGNYTIVWWAGIIMGLFAFIMHALIKDHSPLAKWQAA